MKTSRKIWISLALIAISMLLFPIHIIKLSSPDLGFGLCFILFFAIDPITVIILTLISWRDFKKLFWIPILAIAAFPPLFSFSVSEMIWDLYIYSAFYLFAALITLLICYLMKKMFRNKKRRRKA